ncbi:MAG TPA: nucleobase:cation symporter-2 family protein [Burkholderiales bacterium]|nr:nucleobase:cation symporter-2 family protein [Burkholderiales bacterium]
MSNAAAAAAHDHGASSDRGFTKLELQLNDYPGPTKTALFGIQHVLVMFTAMVGGPLIVARLLNLPPETRIEMVTGTMIGCGLATIVSALGVGFVGPRLPIVMGVFYIFIGPLVAIGKGVSLAAAMTALMIGGMVQLAWSPLIGKLHRFFPPIVTGTTILLIGTGLMKIGIGVATGANTPAFGQPLTLGLAALMIVLILVISRFATGFVRALSLFITMVIGYLISASLGLLNFQSVVDAGWIAIPKPFPYGGLEWPPIAGIIAVIVCFFATAVETTGHTLAVCRITGVPAEGWRIRGAVSNDGIGSAISALFGGMALTSYSQNIGVISITGVGSRFVVAAGGAFLVIMALIPKVGALIALMPNAVLGGVLLFMFGMVASVGVDIIGSNMRARRDALIVAASLAVGLGIQAAPPNAFDAIPQAARVLVTDGIVMGIMVAMFLNIVMPREDGK